MVKTNKICIHTCVPLYATATVCYYHTNIISLHNYRSHCDINCNHPNNIHDTVHSGNCLCGIFEYLNICHVYHVIYVLFILFIPVHSNSVLIIPIHSSSFLLISVQLAKSSTAIGCNEKMRLKWENVSITSRFLTSSFDPLNLTFKSFTFYRSLCFSFIRHLLYYT